MFIDIIYSSDTYISKAWGILRAGTPPSISPPPHFITNEGFDKWNVTFAKGFSGPRSGTHFCWLGSLEASTKREKWSLRSKLLLPDK